MISQASASVTGTARPKAGRMNRTRRLAADRSCAGVPSAAMVMLTRDMVASLNAMWSFPRRCTNNSASTRVDALLRAASHPANTKN
jgi:hypothetical protein